MATHTVTRDKADGTVTVKIRDGAISIQKADSLARGMYPPAAVVRFLACHKRAHGTVTVRRYLATNWV